MFLASCKHQILKRIVLTPKGVAISFIVASELLSLQLFA